MAKTLHPKIMELKKRSAPIQYSSASVSQDGSISESFPGSDFDNRILAGYSVTWKNKNDYGETFVKGSASKSINDRGPKSNAKMPIKLLNFHKQDQPLALLERLEENDTGLYFRSKPFDDVPWADFTLTQLRSGTIDNFSIGWNYVWDKLEYDDKTDTLIVLEMELFEISPVSLASDSNTYALRGKQSQEEFSDELEYFIKSLPRTFQLEARNLFARQKSLLSSEPLDEYRKTLGQKPIKKRAIDYNYLLQNFQK